MKPLGGTYAVVPKPFVPHLTPGSSGFVFLLKSNTEFCFALFFKEKGKFISGFSVYHIWVLYNI